MAGASNEIEEARAALVSAIVGVDQAQHHPADSKTGSFERVKLSKLVNIFLRKPVVKPVVKPVKHQQKGLPAVDTPPRNDAPGQGGSKVDTGDAGPGWLLDSLKKSEKELVHRNDKIRTLESQIKTLLGAGVGARPQTVGGLTMPPLSPLVPGGQRRRRPRNRRLARWSRAREMITGLTVTMRIHLCALTMLFRPWTGMDSASESRTAANATLDSSSTRRLPNVLGVPNYHYPHRGGRFRADVVSATRSAEQCRAQSAR